MGKRSVWNEAMFSSAPRAYWDDDVLILDTTLTRAGEEASNVEP